MSLVIAEIKDGVVHMGADTQGSGEISKTSYTSESNLKISKMPHGIIIGSVGVVPVLRILTCHKEWFEKLGSEPLSKKFITTKIVPKFYNELEEMDWLTEKDPAGINNCFLIAQCDRLFLLKDDFTVNIVPKLCAIGCGQDAAEVVYAQSTDLSVREKMLKALRLASKFDNGVGAPYVFVNTDSLAFEFVEE